MQKLVTFVSGKWGILFRPTILVTLLYSSGTPCVASIWVFTRTVVCCWQPVADVSLSCLSVGALLVSHSLARCLSVWLFVVRHKPCSTCWIRFFVCLCCCLFEEAVAWADASCRVGEKSQKGIKITLEVTEMYNLASVLVVVNKQRVKNSLDITQNFAGCVGVGTNNIEDLINFFVNLVGFRRTKMTVYRMASGLFLILTVIHVDINWVTACTFLLLLLCHFGISFLV